MELSPRLCLGLSLSLLLLLATCRARDDPPPTAEGKLDTNCSCRRDSLVRDCSDVTYGSPSGVYILLPDLVTPTPAFCDLSDGEGWTVFQHRADVLPRQSFYLNYEAYQLGFGIFDGEFWCFLNHL